PQSWYLPDSIDGPVTLRFPYSFTLARAAMLPRLRNVLARRAEWSNLYRADHPSGALQLMVAICEAFVEFASSHGKKTLIVILPVIGSFREQFNHGTFEYVPLVAALRDRKIEVFDPGAAILAERKSRSICGLFTRTNPETVLSAPA